MYTHYLITRFNIKIAEHGPERMNYPVADEDWLMNRLRLFLDYCAPSVMNQENKNFTWLIYFDTHTPKSILEAISYLKNLHHNTEFIFVEDFKAMLDHTRELFKNTGTHYIISSRLDNDDVISDQFIRMIQDAFIPETNTVININAGYVYNLKLKVLTKWRNKFTNQFSSIIELSTSADYISIYGFPHWKPPDFSPTRHVLNQPGWIEIIHSGNNRSRSTLGIPVFSVSSLQAFPTSVRKLRISIWNTFLYACRWIPKVILRRLKSLFQ
jgi:hypothetical protein